MNEWYLAKFLPLDLMVKRTNQNDFYPLSHLVNENPASPFHLSFSSIVTNNNAKSSSVISQNLKKEDPVITPEFAKLLGIDSNSIPVSATPTSIPLNVPNSNVANPPFSSFKNSSGGFPISNFNFGNSFAQPTIDPSLLYYSNAMPVPMNPAFNLMDPLQLQAQLQLQMQLQQQYQSVPIHPQYFNDPQFVMQSQLLQNQMQNQNNLLQSQIPIANLQMQIPNVVQNQNLNQFQQPIQQQVQLHQSAQPIAPADQRKTPQQQQQQKEVQPQQPAQPSPQPPVPSPSPSLSSSSENNQNKGQSQAQAQSRSAKKKKNKKAKNATNSSPNSPAKSNENFPTIVEPSFPSPVKPSSSPAPSSPAPSPAPSSVQSPDSSQWPALSSKKQSKKEKANVQAVNNNNKVSSSAAPKATPWSNIVAKPDNINDINNNSSSAVSSASVVKANSSLSSSSSSLPNSAPKQANKLNSSGNNNNNNNNNNKADKKSSIEEPSWVATVIPPRSVQEIQKEELEQKKKQKAQEKIQRNIAENEINNQKKLSVASSPWATVLSPEAPSKVLFSDIQQTDKILSKAEREERKKINSYQQQVEETKKASPWKTPVATVTKSKAKSLFEIQQEEKRLLEQQQEIERNLQIQQAATMGTTTATSTSTSWAKKLAPPPSSRPKSLREIQEEELLTRKVLPQKGASNAPVGWKTVWNNNPVVDSNNNNNINNAPSTPPKAVEEDVQSDQSAADLLWAQSSNSKVCFSIFLLKK